VFVAPPGIGKTVLGTYLVAKRPRSTLVLVHRRPLLDQWVAQLSMFLGIEEKEVGRVGGAKRKPNGRLDVAMIQSLVREGRVDESVATYGQVSWTSAVTCRPCPSSAYSPRSRPATSAASPPHRTVATAMIPFSRCSSDRFASP
jgi:hypothetical protein